MPEWTRRPLSPPLKPSGPVRAPEGRRDPLRGSWNVPLGGARGGMERPTPGPGDAPPGPREDGTPRLEGSGWRRPFRGSRGGEGTAGLGAGVGAGLHSERPWVE